MRPAARHVLITSVARAAALGVDGVKVLMPWDTPAEERADCAELVATVIREAEPFGLPVMVEPICLAAPRPPDAVAIEGDGARMAAELGADIIKVMYPGDPELLSAWCAELGVPLVILGGPAGGGTGGAVHPGRGRGRGRRARHHDRPPGVAAPDRGGHRGARPAGQHRAPGHDCQPGRLNLGAMAKLIYWANTSLDGYINDEDGRYDWTTPGDEVFRFITDFERPIGTYLYGRRLYQEMIYWETAHEQPGQSDLMLDFARVWQAADKIVYSTTLDTVSSPRTRIERTFDPEAIRQLKARADRDITVGYAGLAGQAIKAGLVDECHLMIFPVLVGGGTRALPDGAHGQLELLGQGRVGDGAVHLHYRFR